jgi:hypothetical protein
MARARLANLQTDELGTGMLELKNKHLVDLRSEAEQAIEMEGHRSGVSFGFPADPSPDLISMLEARIAEINAELTRRGMAEDGFTILNESAYDAWSGGAHDDVR